jgi:hypothetical protein
MESCLRRELAGLPYLSAAALRERYAQLFGEATRTGNKTWLIKRIAWRLQVLAEGDLSARARQRAAELAHDADLRLAPPRVEAPPAAAAENTPRARGRRVHDRRLPPPGTILRRPYKGLLLQVQVLDDGFAFAGTVYPSLSAVAKAITGSHCNGFLFFRLTTKGVSA